MNIPFCVISVRPVCECGHVFTDLSCTILGFSAAATPIFRFDPEKCPGCGKPISGFRATGYEDDDHNVILISSKEEKR